MNNKMEHIAAEIKFMDQSDSGISKITGYAAVFGNEDSHGDIIEKGAFTNTIQSFLSRKVNLYSSHSLDARDMLGTVTKMQEDDFGLYFEAEISSAPSAQDLAIKAREGHLNEVSIGFFITDKELIKDAQGRRIRHIKEIELIEISLVSRASNPKARTLLVKEETYMSEENNKEVEIKEEVNEVVETEVKSEVVETEIKQEKEALMEEKNFELIEKMAKQIADMEAALAAPVKKTPAGVVERKEIEFEIKNEDELDAFVGLVNGDVSPREYKALSSSVDKNGGLLVPKRLEEKILEEKDRLRRVEARVEKIQVDGPISLVDFDFSETLGAHDEGDNFTVQEIENAYGKSSLDPQDFGVMVKVPRRLERRSFVAMEGFLARRYAKQYMNQKEDHILLGTGVKQPVGIVTLLNDLGINTVTAANLAAIDYDDLVDCTLKLDEEYRSNAVFIVHKDALGQIMKLKDSNNMPIWNRPVAAGNPSTLLGYPIFESKSLEDGADSGESPIVFADLSLYLMAEEIGFRVEVLRELYAGSDQIGLKMSASYDGMPIDKNGFARIDIT
jgi:hypothetical protein